MPDAIFADPRLAQLYDPLDPDRSDLDTYLSLVEEFEATSVVDIGCGTGTFACMLAERGLAVTGVDPAAASLAVARTKPFADRVRWIHGDATTLSDQQVDLVTMTANVAQVFLTDDDFGTTLDAARRALKPTGHLVFEVRDPAMRAWEDWNRQESWATTHVEGVGPVEHWVAVVEVAPPLVRFRWTYRFVSTGESLISESTLRFRARHEVIAAVEASGMVVVETRDAPDRPGLEWVFVCSSAQGEPARNPRDFR